MSSGVAQEGLSLLNPIIRTGLQQSCAWIENKWRSWERENRYPSLQSWVLYVSCHKPLWIWKGCSISFPDMLTLVGKGNNLLFGKLFWDALGMKGISKVVVTSPQLPWVRSWTACPFRCRALSLSQFSQSSALTFWALIDFLPHVTLHFPLEGGCRESTSFSRLLREHGFVLGGAVSCGLGEAPRVRQCWSRSVFFAIIIPSASWVTCQITSHRVLYQMICRYTTRVKMKLPGGFPYLW